LCKSVRVSDATGQTPSVDGVTIHFELNREESLPILRWQARGRKQVKYLQIVAVFFMVVGIAALIAGTGAGQTAILVAGATMLGYGVFELAVIRWAVARGPARAWDKVLSDAGPRMITFTDDGVHVVSRMTTALNRWEGYSETLEKNGMYLLRLARVKTFAAYVFVPKRAFPSSDDEQAFRRLAATHTKANF
jgi:hypothetical protein